MCHKFTCETSELHISVIKLIIFLSNFSLDPFEEDVFEAMSCYFPIDFSPPRGGSLEITKEDLVLGLRNCLSASELFAPLAMPLFIEKLDSDLQVKFALFTKQTFLVLYD